MTTDLLQKLKILAGHPFNDIGLADREKFHTGMIGFALKQSKKEPDEFTKLCKFIWPRYQADITDEVCIETNSLDLSLRRGNAVKAFCEVKLKTDLSHRQMEKYLSRYENGTLASLFPTTTKAASNKINQISLGGFAEKISLFDLEADSTHLIKMWKKYIIDLQCVTQTFVEHGHTAIPKKNEISNQLRKLKLKGVFERHRFALIGQALIDDSYFSLYEKAEDKQSGQEFPHLEQFNTRGNAGLTLSLGKISFQENLFTYGLQWQADVLKFFVDNEDVSAKIVKDKHDFLENFRKQLPSIYIDGSLLNQNISHGKKFRSITIRKWPIFGDLSKRKRNILDIKSQITKHFEE